MNKRINKRTDIWHTITTHSLNLALMLALFFACSCAPSQAATEDLVILHTNDMHGYLLPQTDVPDVKPPAAVGGAAYLATVVKKQRDIHRGHFLLLDGGDTAQGTMYSYLCQGLVVWEFMNVLKYDATVLGNHEFDWGKQVLLRLFQIARFPVLSANIIRKNDGDFLRGVQPYVIKEVSGMKVAIIGLTTMNTAYSSLPDHTEGLVFLQPVDSCKRQIRDIKRSHPDIKFFIVLSHLGYIEDQDLAKKIPEIDVIVGGHSHTVLDTPLVAGNTVIVQAGCNLLHYGLLELKVNTDTGRIVSYTRSHEVHRILCDEITPDPEVERIVQNYVDQAASEMDRVAGSAAEDITHRREAGRRDTSMGDLVCDAMRETAGSDIAFYTTSGVRNQLKRGTITYNDIFQVIPYDFTLVTLNVSGADILRILNFYEQNKYFLQVSGFTFDYNPAAPAWKRFSNAVIAGQPLDPKKTYSIATTDLIHSMMLKLRNEQKLDLLRDNPAVTRRELVRDALVDYVGKHSPLTENTSVRIREQ